jgi:LysM repeat protein
MTTPPDTAAEPARAPDGPGPATPDEPSAPAKIGEICPYLLASQGGWRSAGPSRDHRCTAVDPPAALSADKQRSLCLVAEHASCPAFRAARAARASMIAPGVDPSVVAAADAARRPVARAAPVIVEGPRLGLGSGSGTWPLSQAALVGLMIVAFAVVLVARISTPGAATPSPSPSPIATASPSPSPTPTPIPTPTVAPSGSGVAPSGSGALPSAAASQAGAASGPAFGTTYRVKAGDTLVGIASTFGTTVGELQRVDRLAGSDLRIGQLVRIR